MYEYVYCVSCIAGFDAAVARNIEQTMQIRAISMSFEREEHKDGKWTVKTYPLVWGYVFLYADEPVQILRVFELEHVTRILRYSDGEINLCGDDRRFAEWALQYNGLICLSKALLIGDRTHIIDGPLKNYEGKIRSINRQKGKALVDITIGELIKPTWLYFEWLTTQDGKLIKLRDASKTE